MNTLLTEEEVAKRLHVSLASIRRWRLERRGPQFIKVGSLVVPAEDLESWLASLPTGGAQPVKAETALRQRAALPGDCEGHVIIALSERRTMSVFKRGKVWWYEFWFAGRRIPGAH